MKYIFIPHTKGTKVKDGIRGMLSTLKDSAVVRGGETFGSIDGITDYVEPVIPEKLVPKEIANWRAKAVLEIAGLLPAIEQAISSIQGAEGIVIRAAWSSGASLDRNGPTVKSLSKSLGLTKYQVDSMFVQAANLSV